MWIPTWPLPTRYRSLGYSSAELEGASEDAGRTADETLQGVLGLTLTPTADNGSDCGAPGAQVTVPYRAIGREGRLGGKVELRRFATDPSIDLGSLGPGQAGNRDPCLTTTCRNPGRRPSAAAR